MENNFTAIIKKVNNYYVGFVAELPGANSQGKTIEETRENLKEAITMVLQANREIAESSLDGTEIRERIEIND
jgi:predicted RNase H-like HicB family nuclease